MTEGFYKGKRGNTGLGMAIVEDIVKRHGGIIQAYNEPGKEPLVKIEERKFDNWSEELTVPPLSSSIYELTVD